MQGETFFIQIRPIIPESLMRLEEIAADLWFSWNANARTMFYHMDHELWLRCNHNPRLFLRRISQTRLNELARDRAFLSRYRGISSDYDAYREQEYIWFASKYGNDEINYNIAYFSAEFGLHESLPIYSGGLGILAGDHCKSASDLGLPFTAVGLLYRQGYFYQQIDCHGNQIAIYNDNRFEDLCISPAINADGDEVFVQVDLPGRVLNLKIWQAIAGHMRLLLLDADLDNNSTEDRGITFQLYGGDNENRIKQEICLGIGGVRALHAMGIAPTVWHANEGHAAFIILERMLVKMNSHGLSFEEALEAVRAATVFTTHTPVPAGHDIFPWDMFDHYVGHGYAAKMEVGIECLHALGTGDFGHGSYGFNQTALAIHGSSFQNGVAALHGKVSSHICAPMWPNVPEDENPMSSVTNGVHTTTWLAQEWISVFDHQFGGSWRSMMVENDFWQCIHQIDDSTFWSTHQTNKSRLLQHVRTLLVEQAQRNGESLSVVRRMTQSFDIRTLVIGFARRFATYKRATLLLHDEERLRLLLENTDRPVVFLFAGKAHPADKPGQALIRRIHEVARKPEFIGKILMLEGYDMSLGRYMTSGVDIWLNNPRRPMEASGTSGMKAAMNGVPNLSILDGWWPEGFSGDNGWAIGGEREMDDEQRRDDDDVGSLYHVLQHEIIPLYYARNESGYSDGWVHVCKRSMETCIPRFNTARMVSEYTNRFYVPASKRSVSLHDNNFDRSRKLAMWKQKIRQEWDLVCLEPSNELVREQHVLFDQDISISVQAHIGSLSVDDVCVEAVLYVENKDGMQSVHKYIKLAHQENNIFFANIHPGDTGNFTYRLRIYPQNSDLPHVHDCGLMTWL
ncbi:MAG: alpha-glucan family phosphorylase [Mariprofundales bacterium]